MKEEINAQDLIDWISEEEIKKKKINLKLAEREIKNNFKKEFGMSCKKLIKKLKKPENKFILDRLKNEKIK